MIGEAAEEYYSFAMRAQSQACALLGTKQITYLALAASLEPASHLLRAVQGYPILANRVSRVLSMPLQVSSGFFRPLQGFPCVC